MSPGRGAQPRAVKFVLGGLALAVFTMLGPLQVLVLGVGMVLIGSAVMWQRRRRRRDFAADGEHGSPPT